MEEFGKVVEDGHAHRKVIIQVSEVRPVINGDRVTDVLEGASKGDKDMMLFRWKSSCVSGVACMSVNRGYSRAGGARV